MVRSIVAVVAGYSVMVVGALLLFVLWFRDAAVAPTLGFLLFSAVWRFAAAVVGGYVTASLAPRPMEKRLLALMALALVVSLASTVSGAGSEPLWHQMTGLALTVLGVWLGGHLRDP